MSTIANLTEMQLTRRKIAGTLATNTVTDPEIRRVLDSVVFQLLWMLDNWPRVPKPLQFKFSVANYEGVVQLVGDEVPQRVRRFYGHNEFGKFGYHKFKYPEHRMSVVNTNEVVTLVNDETDPDYGQFYGVGLDVNKGWQYPREHPWRFQQTNDAGGDLTPGLVRIKGVDKVHGEPAKIAELTESMRYWIAVDTTAETAVWASGTFVDFPDFPTGDDHTIIFPILALTCDTRTETIGDVEVEVVYISGIEQRRWSDIGVGAAAAELPDPVEPDPGYITILSRDGNDPPQGPGDSTPKQDDWTAGGVNALHEWINFGTVWDGYGVPPKLYNMMRQHVTTTDGRSFYTGVEVLITIDTPVNHDDL